MLRLARGVTQGGRSGRSSARPAPVWTPARALRQECLFVAVLATLLSLLAFAYCSGHNLLLLYGDAVAHLHIARRIFDSINPGFRQLGSVWLPLPHLLLLPFVQKLSWWQSGLAGAPPSMLAYVLGVAGLYRLARYWLDPPFAGIAAAFYALNPGLLYMQTTAMNEPLFLAEMIWATVLLTAFTREATEQQRPLRRLLVSLGLVLAAAVFTRYDGWPFAALAWCFAAASALRKRLLRRPAGAAFLLFTAIVLAAPFFWLAYNAKQFHDPLDFMRGPYSARAIELKTTPPGAGHYPGWHHYGIAAHYFLKTAELGATPAHSGNVLLALALGGVILAIFAALPRAPNALPSTLPAPTSKLALGPAPRGALAVFALFWLPWPFYAYSVAYGSVPIFIPPWPPYAWYNTRYGMELLPAFALSLAFVVDASAAALRRWRSPSQPPTFQALPATAAVALAAALIVLNAWALVRATPLVFAEAVVNSRTRIAFEGALARALAALPPGRILIYSSDHIGALQQAGIPLVRTINDTDYQSWNAALANPSQAAPFVVAIEGDAVARAIAAHPGGLNVLDVVCSTGQPCARIYASSRLPQSFFITPDSRPPRSGSISPK